MLALERFFPHYVREKSERVLFAVAILFLSFSVFFELMIDTPFGVFWPIAQGLFLVSFALLLLTILIEIYAHSLRVRLESRHEMSLATLLVIGFHHPEKRDLAKAFLHSKLGQETVERLGIGKDMLRDFVKTKPHFAVEIPEKGFFGDLAGYIHDEDPYFRDFFDRVHVSKDHLVASAESAEKKHRARLSYRPFLSHAFRRVSKPVFSLDHVARTEIEELEHFYRIIITEQAIQQIVGFFKEEMLRYVSESERLSLLTELIESSLSEHKKRFHGASIIMPADVRRFLINTKAS